jgi:hypothetical protein
MVVVVGSVVDVGPGAGGLVTMVVSAMFTPPPPGSPVHATASTMKAKTILRALTK